MCVSVSLTVHLIRISPCIFFPLPSRAVHDGAAQEAEGHHRVRDEVLPEAAAPGRQAPPRQQDHPQGPQARQPLPQRRDGAQDRRLWLGHSG